MSEQQDGATVQPGESPGGRTVTKSQPAANTGGIGPQLRTAREEKGLALQQVAEATRIPLNYLEAIETESYSIFSSEVHVRGFMRNYAAFLGLKPDEVVAAYDQQRGHLRTRASKPRQSVSQSGTASRPKRASMLVSDLLLGLVLLSVLSLIGITAYQGQTRQEPTPTAGAPPTPTVTPMPVYDGTGYSLGVYLNYEEHRLDVQERIDYTNGTSQTLPNLILNVPPNHSRGTFTLNDIKVALDGEVTQPEVFPLDVTLRVELPRQLKPAEHVMLLLDFTLTLPKIDPGAEFGGGGFGYSKQTASLGNWYPVLAPYRADKGWYGLTYFPVGDPYVTDVADYSVTITTAAGIVIAGSGTETRTGNRWHYTAEQARSFAFAASPRYLVSTAQLDGATVHSYYLPGNEAAGEAALQTAAQAMELFSELYGPYPYRDYRLAETEFAGSMEFTGLTFLGSVFYDRYDGTTRSELIPLTAHEVSHQWFYGLVGNDQVREPWLDEAPAEYSSFLYYERYLPDDSDWWWSSVVDQWAPTGKIDTLIYEFRDNRSYVDAVYRRGALFLRDLRTAMGDPAFFAFLREYQRRYQYGMAKSQDFIQLVLEFTTADLISLQEEYFRQRVLPYP